MARENCWPTWTRQKATTPALYGLMRERGWLGQFNHPAVSGQFTVAGQPLGYTPDGDAAMVLVRSDEYLGLFHQRTGNGAAPQQL